MHHRFLERPWSWCNNRLPRQRSPSTRGFAFNRPIGEPVQELSGTMVTLVALATANGLNMDTVAETELDRAWKIIDKIRAIAAAKPKFSPLPQ
jgi:hypothetical protein